MSLISPYFSVPAGTETAQVRIIDSSTRIEKLPVDFLMKPPLDGMKYMPTLPSWSFLIEHSSGQKALFDLGVPKDWHSLAPSVVDPLESRGWDITVDKEVIDILQEDGIAADQINSIIWSHWHWDHLGDPSRFPSCTELVVGPGFKDSFLPGYPAKKDAPVRESDFAGRTLREINFYKNNSIQVGHFRAFDFFSDGSFYLLDTPGHAIGHLSGLARTTTNPDTFIFMGGDLCHHSGEIRPSEHLRIPTEVTIPSVQFGLPCPGAIYEKLLEKRNRSSNEPFFEPAMGLNISQAMETIVKAQDADANENIWFIYAHDPSLYGVADLFPLPANKWRENDWRKETLWHFLQDFEGAISR